MQVVLLMGLKKMIGLPEPSGMTIEELLTDYPDLEHKDFLACLEYASKLVQVKSIHKIAS